MILCFLSGQRWPRDCEMANVQYKLTSLGVLLKGPITFSVTFNLLSFLTFTYPNFWFEERHADSKKKSHLFTKGVKSTKRRCSLCNGNMKILDLTLTYIPLNFYIEIRKPKFNTISYWFLTFFRHNLLRSTSHVCKIMSTLVSGR